MRLRAAFLAILLLLALRPGVARASAEGEYQMVRDAYLGLKADEKRQRYRDSYLPILEGFERFEAEHRSHPRAPDALYNAGQLGWSLYKVSRLRSDLRRALDAFEALAERHPRSKLADDALCLMGEILLAHGGDASEAYLHFAAAAERYPKGDMAPTARAQVKALAAHAPKPAPKAPAAARAVAGKVELREVRTSTEEGTTRIVLHLSGPARFRQAEIPPDDAKERPARFYVDLQQTVLGEAAPAELEVEGDLVETVRAGQFSPDTVRVVLKGVRKEQARVFTLTEPDRVVIDLRAEGAPANLASREVRVEGDRASGVTLEQKLKAGPDIPLSVQAGLKVRRVVVDAGHGGKDHGAVGKGGLREKDVTLKVAKQVAQRLEKLGLEVVLTRDDDSFVALERRTAIANGEGADLFISIHANAHPRRDRRGVSTYYLDVSSDRYSVRLASLENETSERSISDLQLILADLAKRSNVEESATLARAVQRKTMSELSAKYSDVRNMGVKSALFYVLLGAKMPAVLVETSFISNPTEEKRLGTKAYQEELADGIVEGVKAFLEQRRTVALGLSPG
ncbi:MAG: N-acetylmuramoyl-L-alanine amidase [Deltaproteobacteria bacterium]|nr:N-acetylmuramoyl-L-alanine amidase [Deltaproteobacteria bacterium]